MPIKINSAPGYRFPRDVISHGVWLYHRFSLSFRDVEDLLAQRGVLVTYETVRQWCRKFGPGYARTLRSRQGQRGDIWHMDEVFVQIRGARHYLWRAVDQDGDVLDILVQRYRNAHAAIRFFRKVLKGQNRAPIELVTDRLKSYGSARRHVMPSVAHNMDRYANNRAEVSHQPTRQRERQMRGFKSAGQAQRFLSVHGVIQNCFSLGRHLLRAEHYRFLRERSLSRPWPATTRPSRSSRIGTLNPKLLMLVAICWTCFGVWTRGFCGSGRIRSIGSRTTDSAGVVAGAFGMVSYWVSISVY